MAKLSNEKIAAIYSAKSCNVSDTCLAAGISRQTFYRMIREDKKFRDEIHNAREGLIDWAESKLIEKIDSGDGQCIRFFLSTIGKKRGYVEKTEVKDVTPRKRVTIVLPDNNRG